MVQQTIFPSHRMVSRSDWEFLPAVRIRYGGGGWNCRLGVLRIQLVRAIDDSRRLPAPAVPRSLTDEQPRYVVGGDGATSGSTDLAVGFDIRGSPNALDASPDSTYTLQDLVTHSIVREQEIAYYKAKKPLISILEVRGFRLLYALCEPHD